MNTNSFHRKGLCNRNHDATHSATIVATEPTPRWTSAWLLPLTAALHLGVAACSGGGGAAASEAGVNALTTVVFDRDNTIGGTDLYRAPIDAGEPPVNITRHDFQRVDDVWPAIVAGRIVYTAESGGTRDFYSVRASEPAGSAPAYRRLTAQSIGGPDP
jgi:hypothetical protein